MLYVGRVFDSGEIFEALDYRTCYDCVKRRLKEIASSLADPYQITSANISKCLGVNETVDHYWKGVPVYHSEYINEETVCLIDVWQKGYTIDYKGLIMTYHIDVGQKFYSKEK